MNIRSMWKVPASGSEGAADKIARSADVQLDTPEDLDTVRVLIAVIKGDTDTARDIVRRMSPRDRAVLAFLLREAERIVEEEDSFRMQADRNQAREGHPGFE